MVENLKFFVERKRISAIERGSRDHEHVSRGELVAYRRGGQRGKRNRTVNLASFGFLPYFRAIPQSQPL